MNDQPISTGLAALERATGDRPVAIDDFAREQTAVSRVLDLNPDEHRLWLENLTIEEATFTLEKLDAIRREHTSRARRSEGLEEDIRAALRGAAEYGIDKTTIARASSGIAASAG